MNLIRKEIDIKLYILKATISLWKKALRLKLDII